MTTTTNVLVIRMTLKQIIQSNSEKMSPLNSIALRRSISLKNIDLRPMFYSDEWTMTFDNKNKINCYGNSPSAPFWYGHPCPARGVIVLNVPVASADWKPGIGEATTSKWPNRDAYSRQGFRVGFDFQWIVCYFLGSWCRLYWRGLDPVQPFCFQLENKRVDV